MIEIFLVYIFFKYFKIMYSYKYNWYKYIFKDILNMMFFSFVFMILEYLFFCWIYCIEKKNKKKKKNCYLLFRSVLLFWFILLMSFFSFVIVGFWFRDFIIDVNLLLEMFLELFLLNRLNVFWNFERVKRNEIFCYVFEIIF